MHTAVHTPNRKIGYALLAAVLAVFTLGAAAHAQSGPSIVFSQYNYVSAVNSAFGVTDYGGSAGHIGVNSRGDIFFDDEKYGYPNAPFIVVIPANGSAAYEALINLGSNSNGVTIDSHDNLWAADQSGKIDFVPFINGAYAGAGTDATTLSSCTLPMSTNTVPCSFPWSISTLGYYVQANDIAIDASGNVYVFDKYDGQGGGAHNRVLVFSPVDGSLTYILDGLPSNGNAQIAVDAAGDIFEGDQSNVYFAAHGATTATLLGTGLNSPSGVGVDGAQNLYITDQGNNRIVIIPPVSGVYSSANQYTLGPANSANEGPGIDGNGNIYWVGQYGNSINKMTVGAVRFGLQTLNTPVTNEVNAVFNSAITVGSYAIVGSSAFSISSTAPSSPCSTGAQTAGSYCNLNITFNPTTAGPQTAELVAYNTSNQPINAIELSGTGNGAILNVDPGTIGAITTGFTAPAGIVTAADGTTFFTDSSEGKVYKVVPSTGSGNATVTAVATGLTSPKAIVADANDDLFVAESGQVVVLNNTGTYSSPLVVASGLSGTPGLYLDSSNVLYIADSGNGRVLRVGGILDGAADVTTVDGTFTTPTAVTVDSNGNVYVADSSTSSILETAYGASSSTVFASGFGYISGIAADASNSIFVADASAKTISKIPAGGGTAFVLPTIVASPNAIAVDNVNNVYVVDTADKIVAQYQRVKGSLSFGSINVGSTSSELDATLSNGGNAQLTLSTPYQSGFQYGFSLLGDGTCADGASLNPVASCTLAADFAPTGAGIVSDQIALASTAGNTPVINLSGTGVSSGPLATTTTFTNSANPTAGNLLTFNVAVTAATGTPTGTIGFYFGNYELFSQNLGSNGTLSVQVPTAGLPPSTYLITAKYLGATGFAASTGNDSITLAQPATTTAFTITPTTVTIGQTATFQVSVTTADQTANGTVGFYFGNNLLFSQNLASNGTINVTVPTAGLPASTYQLTAKFLGGSTYLPSQANATVTLVEPAAKHEVVSKSPRKVATSFTRK